MIRALIFILLLFAVATPAPANESPKTIITDQAEADLLLGRHLFAIDTLAQWYFGEYINFGEVDIKNKNNSLYIKGGQVCYNRKWSHPYNVRGGSVALDGRIISIESKSFTLNGSVRLYLEPYTSMSGRKPMECKSNGFIHFSRERHPKYWRMQNTEMICGPDRDYFNIDIFLSPLSGKPQNKNCAVTRNDALKLPNP